MSGNSGSGGGNARDNRQRGNAAQLLEKYKSMARDSQLAGDRVQTEYYLQFADHYFRVLEEGRARFEDQQQSQQPRRNRDDEDEFDNDDEVSADGDGGDDEVEAEPAQRPQRRERPDRAERPQQRERYANDRPDRAERTDRPERQDRPERTERQERPERAPRAERPAQASANGNRRDVEDERDERISLGVLPPAIGASEPDTDEAPKPRRRVRKPRADDDGGDIAPVA